MAGENYSSNSNMTATVATGYQTQSVRTTESAPVAQTTTTVDMTNIGEGTVLAPEPQKQEPVSSVFSQNVVVGGKLNLNNPDDPNSYGNFRYWDQSGYGKENVSYTHHEDSQTDYSMGNVVNAPNLSHIFYEGITLVNNSRQNFNKAVEDLHNNYALNSNDRSSSYTAEDGSFIIKISPMGKIQYPVAPNGDILLNEGVLLG